MFKCLFYSNLVWKLDNGDGLCLDYPNIALHAVSSDLNAFPHECLYVMLDNNITSKTVFFKCIIIVSLMSWFIK